MLRRFAAPVVVALAFLVWCPVSMLVLGMLYPTTTLVVAEHSLCGCGMMPLTIPRMRDQTTTPLTAKQTICGYETLSPTMPPTMRQRRD